MYLMQAEDSTVCGHFENEVNAIGEYLVNVYPYTDKNTQVRYAILGRLGFLTCTRTWTSSDDLCSYVMNDCILSTRYKSSRNANYF